MYIIRMIFERFSTSKERRIIVNDERKLVKDINKEGIDQVKKAIRNIISIK